MPLILSGIAAYVKALRPDIKVIGVEADDAAGKREESKLGNTQFTYHDS